MLVFAIICLMKNPLFELSSDRADRLAQVTIPKSVIGGEEPEQDLFPDITAIDAASYHQRTSSSKDVADFFALPYKPDVRMSRTVTEEALGIDLKTKMLGAVFGVLALVGTYTYVNWTGDNAKAQLDRARVELNNCYSDIPTKLKGTETGEQMRLDCVQRQTPGYSTGK